MSAPDKCPRCEAEIDTEWGVAAEYKCKSVFTTGAKEPRLGGSHLCLTRQLAAAQTQIATLKVERVETNLATQRLAARVKELEEALRSLRHADGCYCDVAFAMAGHHPRHTDECERAMRLLGKEKQ